MSSLRTPIILIISALLLAACDSTASQQGAPASATARPIRNTPTTAMLRPPLEVSFTNSAGMSISGSVYGTGKTWVICSHMNNTDRSIWSIILQPLTIEAPYSVLTYDFPGFGKSPGPSDVAHLDDDLQAAVDFARQQGATRIVLLGASMGGTATIKVAAKNASSIAAIVVMSAPADFQGLQASDDELKALTMPKLFINSEGDANYNTTIHMFDISPQPKDKEIYPGSDHGTNIFTTHEEAIGRVVQFIQKNVPAS